MSNERPSGPPECLPTSELPKWATESTVRPRVAILGVPGRQSVRTELNRLRPSIAQHAEIVAEDLEFNLDFNQIDVDLVIVLGGDGSILQAARQMETKQVPVLGVNCGRLGFLAAIAPDEFLSTWPKVCRGELQIVNHLMLRTTLFRDGKARATQVALNEVAVLGGPPYRVLEMDLFADGDLATHYRCDGLIIATPVGSTAHNLSAGGPILRRTLQAVVISPISPHTLTYRPLVDSADTVFELRVTEPNDSTGLVVDGRILSDILPDDRIRIERAETVFQMISIEGQNDYRALREKLGWGGSTPVARSSIG